jgi:hypothetical protein
LSVLPDFIHARVIASTFARQKSTLGKGPNAVAAGPLPDDFAWQKRIQRATELIDHLDY